MADLAGYTIHERYRFDHHLGEGTFSKVYRVHDMRRNVDLAAKVLKADIADNPEFVERFRREGDVLSRLQHPHIVRYYDLIETDEAVFILMDYIPGQTLQAHFHRLGRPMSINEMFNYLKPLTSALHYAHGEGIVHRDLKPGNILIHETGNLLVTDFGIAQILDESGNAVTHTNFGTPLYMAPEQILNEVVSPATDIYSLGVVLYQLLTGSVPFGGTTPTAIGKTPSERVAYEHLHLQAPFLRQHNPTIPLAVEEVVLRSLSKHPMRRPTSVRDVYNELAEAIGAAPSELTPLPVIEQPPPEITLPEISQFMKLANQQESSDETQETNGIKRIIIATEEETSEAVFPKDVLEGRPPTQESGRYARIPQYLPPDEISITSPTPPGVVIPKAPTFQMHTPTAGVQVSRQQKHWNSTAMMISGVALVLVSFLALSAYMGGFIGGDNKDDNLANVGNIPTITPQAQEIIAQTELAITPTATPTVQDIPATSTTATEIAEIPLYSEGLIVYASHRTGNLDIYITDPNATLGSRLQLTTNANLNETGPAVSPDGRQIAFYAAPINSDDYDIYLMNINGTNIRNLTDSPDEDDRYVSWSPNGEYLAFHSNRREENSPDSRDYEIYLYHIESGRIEQLTDNAVNDFGPDWSSDGTKIAYYSYDEGWRVYVLDLETRESVNITPNELEARFPTWSPDGTQLVFHVTDGDSAQIYIVNADGSNVRPLMQNPGNDSFPDWSPDGTQIVFQRRDSDGIYGLYRYRLADGLLLPIGNPLGDFFPDWTDASPS